MTAWMMEASGIWKHYDGKAVVRDVSFGVKRGDIVGLLGPNGSGKTTIVRLMNGVITADKGRLTVGGLDPAASGSAIRQMSGVVTEGAGLYPDMSAIDNLMFFAELYGVRRKRERSLELLEQFGLAAHADKPAGTFSTGMKKRLALAKALLHEPELLFLDEPTNGLDPEGIREVIASIKALNAASGTTILLCSHVLHQLEDVCGSYLFLDYGTLIEQGTREALEAKYRREVMLKVTTGLDMRDGEDRYRGLPVERVGQHELLFTLPSEDDVTGLLHALTGETWVHAAERLNRDLESLYFEVRRRHHEA